MTGLPGLADTRDPSLLIPGSLGALYDDAAALDRQVGELEAASDDVLRQTIPTWLGDAAGLWGERRPETAARVAAPVPVYQAAAEALRAHAGVIEMARELVEVAIELWERGAVAAAVTDDLCLPVGAGLPAGALRGGSAPGLAAAWTSPLGRSLRQQWAPATPTVPGLVAGAGLAGSRSAVTSPFVTALPRSAPELGSDAALCVEAERLLVALRVLVARSASAVAEFLDACCADMPDGRFHPGHLLVGIWQWVRSMGELCVRFSTPRLLLDGDAYVADGRALVAGSWALIEQATTNPHDANRLLLDSETFRDDPALWLGRMTPDAALALFTGGAGATIGKLGKAGTTAARLLEKLADARGAAAGTRAVDAAEVAEDIAETADDVADVAEHAPPEAPVDWRDEFAQLPTGSSARVGLVQTEAELRELFDTLTRSAESLPSPDPKIPEVYRLSDGTRVQWRTSSTSGGPTVDFFPPVGKAMKVHVIQGQ